ncbi:spore coat U domain-containing protein [Paraburkholderia sp. Ac-20340]|uniref:Csu type fimbrial protein n=1 Tax=Paraburkholderia sp. Ac-20340 TaxID=2703888 RepID=UPI001F11FDAF|nr:spore coat U domain-containing protein [Paraburkholderia sp. Ac-20340]
MSRSRHRLVMLCASVLLCVLATLMPGRAHAQTCTATVSSISFGTVSPITRAAVNGSGTINVTCNWTVVSLAPTALVCLNLNATQPRVLTQTGGTATMQYDLYSDQAHSISWGSTGAATTPISVTLQQPLLGTSTTASITYYGQIAANQPTVPTANNGDTVYSHSFSGAETSLMYGYYLLGILGPPGCSSLTTSGGSLAFTASATVTNNCNISASNIVFPAAGVLSSALSATGTITAQCTSGDAFKISLNGGSSNAVNARTMVLSGGSATVGYQIYSDAQHATPWGDGSNGTSAVTGTGSGNTASFTMYGVVPAQSTPQPGTYTDSVTATISF